MVSSFLKYIWNSGVYFPFRLVPLCCRDKDQFLSLIVIETNLTILIKGKDSGDIPKMDMDNHSTFDD